VHGAQGRVANCVETEQLIELSSPKGTVLSSFVQLRGSIPLMWSQIPNIKYKPTTRIAPPDTYARAFDRHVTDLLDIYKVCSWLRSLTCKLPDAAARDALSTGH
jgi:phosphatidylinositol 4-phosphatase